MKSHICWPRTYARPVSMVTVHGVQDRENRPLRNSIDSRRLLAPRAYFVDPYEFGERPDAELWMPPGGDEVSQLIAELVHQCVVSLRRAPTAPSGAGVARRFGFSKQTWSSVSRGHRWPAHTVLAAMVIAVRDVHAGQPANP